MAGEAPAGYVAFVSRHLEPLRRDAARAVGDGHDPGRLYAAVLTDVAARWTWLELERTRFGRPSAADAYLRMSFARRLQRLDARWDVDPAGRAPVWSTDIHVVSPDRPAGCTDRGQVGRPSPARSSAATRQAAVMSPPRPDPGADAAPLAEAAIAWWHAYERHRRRLLIAGMVAVVAVVVIFARLQQPIAGGLG
jgi:hypothetical protein